MNNSEVPSRIFQDLMKLEEDFKYNLTLLKIREEEIERCSNTNRALQEMLNNSLRETDRLNEKVSRLEFHLHESLERKKQEDAICQQNIDNLTQNIIEMKRKHHSQLEEYQKNARRVEAEHAKQLREILKEKEIVFLQKEQILQRRQEAENHKVNNMRSELKSLEIESLSLKNKLRDINSQYTSETQFYKSELKTLQYNTNTIKFQFEQLREEYSSLERKLKETKDENAELALKYTKENTCNTQLINENTEIKAKCEELHRVLQERIVLNSDLIERNRRLTNDKNKLASEKHSSANTIICNVPGHEKFDEISKQNFMLQKVVKAMRQDRGKIQLEAVEDVKVAEKELHNLETLVGTLKNSLTKSANVQPAVFGHNLKKMF